MTIVGRRVAVAATMICAVGIVSGGMLMSRARALPPGGELASHRAVYELTLAPSSRGNSSTVSARGRILYDFGGSACAGYQLEFRQVSELDNGEGKVTLTKPKDAHITIDRAIVFPTEHVRRIIDAARAGNTILEFPVYDGSEKGEKIYNTLTVIGRVIPPNEKVPTDAAAGQQALAGMSRWPVTVSYFDRNSAAGEQTPVYSITFELYENGISRALLLDYNDFAISGELKSLEIRDVKPCP